jgi:thioredoxin 1
MIEVVDKNLESEILHSKIPVLVDFWASWCSPCNLMSSIFEEIEKELDGKLKILKINIEEDMDLSKKFSIRSLPTVILFVDGKEKERVVGAQNKVFLTKKINKYIS